MNKKIANIEQQVQLWAVLGPFVILLSFLLGFYKLSPQHYYLALVPTIGLPICLRSRFWGLLISTSLALGFVFLSYTSLPIAERYWMVGMSLAVSLGMVVTALSLEEVRSLLANLLQESKSRLDNLLRLDEKLSTSREEWNRLQRNYEADLQKTRGDLVEQGRTLELYSKLLPQMQSELSSIQGRREDLLQDLELNRAERAVLDAQLRDAQVEILGLTDAYSMSQDEREKACHRKIADLENSLANADQEFIDLHGRLDLSENASVEARAHVEKLEEYFKKMRQERTQLETQLQVSQRNFEKLQREQNEAQQIHSNLEMHCEMLRESLQREQSEAQQAHSSIEKQCEALRESMQRADEELQTIRQVCVDLQKERQALEAQLQATLQEVPAETVVELPVNQEAITEELAAVQRLANRWQAMYKQLRVQFEEKGKVLGDTRAQLFHTENQFLRLQREVQEDKELTVSEVESSLEAYLQGMEADLSEAEQEQAWSEQAYSELVGSLLDELKTYRSQKQASMV